MTARPRMWWCSKPKFWSRRALILSSAERERAARCRGEDAAVGVEGDTDNAAIAVCLTVAGGLAVLAALAVEPAGRCGAPVLEGSPRCLEAVEGEVTLDAGLGTGAAHLAAFRVDDGIGPVRMERPGSAFPSRHIRRVSMIGRIRQVCHKILVSDDSTAIINQNLMGERRSVPGRPGGWRRPFPRRTCASRR